MTGNILEKRRKLKAEMNQGAAVYIRSLAAAEAAVQRGQFNLAKVLRATALSQQVMALNAARQLAGRGDILEQIQVEISAQAAAPADDSALDRPA